jgi:chemotaxis protein histidine kinase CheA/CheY-like chemotaxis protein
MSLRTSVKAFGSVFTRRNSSTPLGKSLNEFARSVDAKAARKNFPEQQRILTKLAERMLKLASVAGAEDRKIIGGVCTLVATALTQQVRGGARASDDDWRWLARWPDTMLDCLDGGYGEAEALLCHLLESSWADFLSPVAVSALQDRIKELPQAPEMPSAKLMSLYEQYCIQHQAGDRAAIKGGEQKDRAGAEIRQGGEKVAGVKKLKGAGKPVARATARGGDARKEDAAIAAEGTGLFTDTVSVRASEMELPIGGYIPAVEIAARDDGSVMNEYGDSIMSALSKTDMSVSDTLVFDTSVVDTTASDTVVADTVAYDLTESGAADSDAAVSNIAVIDVTESGPAVPDTAVIDTTEMGTEVIDTEVIDTDAIDPAMIDTAVIDLAASAAFIQPEDESPVGTALVVTGEPNGDVLVDQSLTGSSDEAVRNTASYREATVEPMVQASNDDVLTHDGLVGERPASDESRATVPSANALLPGNSNDGDSQRESTSDIGNSRDVEAGSTLLVHTESSASSPDFLAAVQLPLPEIPFPDEALPNDTVTSGDEQRLPASEFEDMADASTENRPVRDEATIDMFDELEVMAINDETDSQYVAALTALERVETINAGIISNEPIDDDSTAVTTGDDERIDDNYSAIDSLGETRSAGNIGAGVVSHTRDGKSHAPLADDSYSGTAPGDGHDDDVVDLGEFVPVEEESASIDDDVPDTISPAGIEQPGLLVTIQSSVFESEGADNNATGTGETDEDLESATAGGLLEAVDKPVVPEEQRESEAAESGIFDPFDSTALGDEYDDDAVDLGEFVPMEEAQAALDDDVPAAAVPAHTEQPGLLATIQSSVSVTGYTGKDTTDYGEVDEEAELATHGDSLAPAAVHTREFRSDAEPALDSILDAFDDAVFGDDDEAENLDELVLAKDAPTSSNVDVPAAAESVDVELPRLLTGIRSSLSGSEDTSQDTTSLGDTRDDARSAPSADPFARAAAQMRGDRREAEPALDDIFDAFDSTAFGDESDDEAANLDDFLVTEEAPTTINDDVPAAAVSASDEHNGILASSQSSVSESDVQSEDESGNAAGAVGRSLKKAAPMGRNLSRAARQIVEVLLAELPKVEVELGICSGLGQSATTDRKVVGEAVQRCADVLKRFGSAADSVGFVGLARIFDIAGGHVRSIAKTESLSETQVGLFTQFSNAVRAYLDAPHASGPAQSLVDWAVDDCWISPAIIDEPEALLSLLANPDLSAIDDDVHQRPTRADPEDVSLAVPADVNSDLLDGLLQELPVQCEEFSAAIERLMHGTGEHEDILVAQRIAHTIKGSGNTVGIRGLAALTHNIEDILLVLAQEKRLPTQPLADMLMNAADRLEAMTESLLGTGPPPEDALEVLQCVLDWANMIDREGLPADDATPQSLPDLEGPPLTHPPLSAPIPASSAVAIPKPSGDVEHALREPAKEEERSVVHEHSVSEERKADSESKADTELEALLRVPARLIDQLLTTAGESIILTGQLRDRVRRALADLNAVSFLFERQQTLGSELEKLIDVKDFSRRQAQIDIRFDVLEMDQYNELHSTARQLVESATDAREMGHALVDHLSSLDEMLIGQEDLNRDTQDTVLHTRMVSVKSVFSRLQRAVRQTCRATAKQAELQLSGGDTPMDSDALIRIVDPLMHLLRNAIDHGIEDAQTRLRNGKTASGTVYLDFQRNGNDVVINCRDDGAGLNYDAIRHAAEERGLIGPDVSLDALKQIILRANFSTRAQASQVSGRGIGLDAVHNSVLALGGTMTVESESGQGCSVEMRLPFNLISSHALLVRSGPNVVALASRGVKQIVHGSDGEMRSFGDKTVFQVGEEMYPAITLEAVIGDNEQRRESGRRSRPVVLAHTGEGVTAVSVESVIGSREIVVKSLGKILPKFRGVVGATILGDGKIAAVIDLPEMLSNRDTGVDGAPAKIMDTPTDNGNGFVLIVDDSLSARRALAQFMQDSGYCVRTARDGLEATMLMEDALPALVLADLEMPRMNGIELTTHLRSTPKTADVPVIMVTSRSTEKHREQALSAGVNAYLTKPYSEDTLVQAVRRLIREQEAKPRERPAA